MNAIQFIKDHGVDKAREVVAKDKFVADLCLITPSGNLIYYKEVKGSFPEVTDFGRVELTADDYLMFDLSDLKRLVESVDIVKDHGGLETIKKCVEKTIFPLSDRIIRMKQAIEDYEQLFGNTETLELGTLRDCDISPNCKKIDLEQVK